MCMCYVKGVIYMKYDIETISYKSSNLINNVDARIFKPKDIKNIKGIVQISHGMCEYIDMYEGFAKFLNDNGYIVCGNSHIGHGKSVNSEKEYGFFADRFGYRCLIKDVYSLTCIMKEKYPDVPYVLLGHSMGSFIARCYIQQYGNEIDGVMLSGTIGPNPLIEAGIKGCNLVIKDKGKMYRSEVLTDSMLKLVFNSKIKHSLTKYDWISRDVNIINKHNNDSMTDFVFTASGYKDLFNLVKYSNKLEYLQKIPKKLPIYIFSGDKDPVGDNGVGVNKVYENLLKVGCKDVNMKLYKNGRHEMLNEINNDKVYKDILNWMEHKVIKK